MPNARTLDIIDGSNGHQTISTLDALMDILGSLTDTAWSGSGNATSNALLKAIAAAVQSTTPSPIVMSLQGKPIAANASSFVLGATGAAGDSLEGIIVQPTGTTVGAVTVYDNTTLMYTYPGGTVGADLRPIVLPFGMASVSGAWKVNFPSNATGLAIGKFT